MKNPPEFYDSLKHFEPNATPTFRSPAEMRADLRERFEATRLDPETRCTKIRKIIESKNALFAPRNAFHKTVRACVRIFDLYANRFVEAGLRDDELEDQLRETRVVILDTVDGSANQLGPNWKNELHERVEATLDERAAQARSDRAIRSEDGAGSSVMEHATDASNKAQVETFLARVETETGHKVKKTAFWTVANFTDRTMFQRWQRNDLKCSYAARKKFERVLRMTPKQFVTELDMHSPKA